MTEEQLKEFLRNNLELDVDTRQELSASIDGDLFDLSEIMETIKEKWSE